MINGVSSTQYIYSGTTSNTSGPAPTYNTTSAYGNDGFAPTTNYSMAASTILSYPISQIIMEDASLAGRYDTWFMGTSDKFLRVGSNWLGKAFLNLLAGNIPLLTSSEKSTQISNNINLWLGRSDLVRTGATPFQSMLLQDTGIKNINDLAIVTNPADQTVLAQMMMAAAVNRGQTVYVDQPTINSWVIAAQQLPKYL